MTQIKSTADYIIESSHLEKENPLFNHNSSNALTWTLILAGFIFGCLSVIFFKYNSNTEFHTFLFMTSSFFSMLFLFGAAYCFFRGQKIHYQKTSTVIRLTLSSVNPSFSISDLPEVIPVQYIPTIAKQIKKITRRQYVDIPVTKDIDEMTIRMQKGIDYLISSYQKRIAEEERERQKNLEKETCLADLEQKVIERLK